MATVLITGANRGIGLALCRRYRERGDTVIAVCRTSSTELEALGVRIETGVDVTSDEAVADLARRLAGEPIDVLIHNAGVFISDSFDKPNLDGIRRQFEVNSIGPLRVTKALASNLKSDSKVAIITSQLGSLGENDASRWYGYRMSKAAVNMAGKCLACDLKDAGVAVALLHPGHVRTDMTRHRGEIEPAESARGLMERIDELTLENSGRFRHVNGREIAW